MISVVIPLFNKQAHIRKTVDSVLNQTFRDFEILVINDGSTDRGAEMLEAVSDSRLRVISQKNAGVSTARNNGVKAAKHNIIAFLDADDWWEPDYLEQMAALVHEYPEAGLWGCAYKEIKNGRERPAQIGVPEGFEKGIINYFEVYANTLWMPVTSSSAIVRKDVFTETGGFKPELKLGEDFHLWSRIALEYPVAYLNRPLVAYNQDVDAVNRGVAQTKWYSPKEHFIFHLGHFEKAEEHNRELKVLLDNLRGYALLKYRLAGKFPEEVTRVLEKMDIRNLRPEIARNYTWPVWAVRIQMRVKRWGSFFKQKWLRMVGM